MKLPFDIEPTTQNLMIIGLIVFIIYLNQTGNLNQITMLIIGGIIVILLISQKGKPKMIDINQAKTIALEYMTKQQIVNEIPQGTIKMLPERELKSFLLSSGNPSENGELISYDYHLITEVSGTPSKYYLVKVGIYGNIIGITETYKKKITEIEPEIKIIQATKVSTTEEFKEMEKEKLEK